MVIMEKSTIKGLVDMLNSMYIPKKDILIMELYYESERKKSYEQLEKSLKTTKAKLKEYQDKEKREMASLSAHMKWQEKQDEKNRIDYNSPG